MDAIRILFDFNQIRNSRQDNIIGIENAQRQNPERSATKLIFPNPVRSSRGFNDNPDILLFEI